VATKFKVGEMVTVVDNFYLDTFCNKVLIVVAYDSGIYIRNKRWQ
jgi:hypothetical protein